MPTAKGVSAPFFFASQIAARRADELLAQATRDFRAGRHGDALLACESVCRSHPTALLPAMLRARILHTALPTLAPRAWEAAWERDPLDPGAQDALVRAWLQAGTTRRAAEHASAFLPGRWRGGTHEPLLALLRQCGVARAGVCWPGEGNNIEVRCVGGDTSGGATVVLSDGERSHEHHVGPGGELRIAVPDDSATWSLAFLGGPLLQGSPVVFGDPAVRAAARKVERGVDIIVPVYRDTRGVQACLLSVLASLPANRTSARVVVVNDASPEPALVFWLEALASSGRITLLHNRFNLGFIESVNRVLRESRRDALLLNADTLVHGDWIDRMCRSLAGARDIASVMPWSNNGELASVVPGESPACDAAQLSVNDTTAARLHRERRLADFEIPTCSGFAMLIRRKAIDAVGVLDGAALSRGYLEEVDWCLRARAAGWRHLLASGVFVAHAGSASFGVEKQLRVRQNRAVIAARYPGYYAEYARFLASDELAAPRQALADSLAEASPPWPRMHARAAVTPDLGQALRTSPVRIGIRAPVWNASAAARVLSLARLIASGRAAQAIRLLVFGHASEALMHTGVVDCVPPSRGGDTLLPDETLASLVGCREFLDPDSLDPHVWIASRRKAA